jgi:hypothetical protein
LTREQRSALEHGHNNRAHVPTPPSPVIVPSNVCATAGSHRGDLSQTAVVCVCGSVWSGHGRGYVDGPGGDGARFGSGNGREVSESGDNGK